ncbi:MAG: glutamate--cysteine ligase, partial [Methanosphaera sp.]|nr:glutamate--cysteine ligase [Methanosphaera sp.]
YWQQEGLLNEELVAESAFNQDTRLLKDGKKIQLSVWASEIIDEISDMNNYLNLGKSEIIKNINDRISNPEKNYGKELIKIIENKGFIESNLSIAINNKETSEKLIDLETIKNNKRLYYYYTNALPNNKIL